MTLVVNTRSGGGSAGEVAEQVRHALPAVAVVELGPDDDVAEALRRAADSAEVLAIAGGDGSVAAAAGVAVERGLPLAVFPGGTLNHFAKDIGCDATAKPSGPLPKAACRGWTWCGSTMRRPWSTRPASALTRRSFAVGSGWSTSSASRWPAPTPC